MSAKTVSQMFVINGRYSLYSQYIRNTFIWGKKKGGGGYTLFYAAQAPQRYTHKNSLPSTIAQQTQSQRMYCQRTRFHPWVFERLITKQEHGSMRKSNHCVNIHVRRRNDGKEAHVSGGQFKTLRIHPQQAIWHIYSMPPMLVTQCSSSLTLTHGLCIPLIHDPYHGSSNELDRCKERKDMEECGVAWASVNMWGVGTGVSKIFCYFSWRTF